MRQICCPTTTSDAHKSDYNSVQKMLPLAWDTIASGFPHKISLCCEVQGFPRFFTQLAQVTTCSRIVCISQNHFLHTVTSVLTTHGWRENFPLLPQCFTRQKLRNFASAVICESHWLPKMSWSRALLNTSISKSSVTQAQQKADPHTGNCPELTRHLHRLPLRWGNTTGC